MPMTEVSKGRLTLRGVVVLTSLHSRGNDFIVSCEVSLEKRHLSPAVARISASNQDPVPSFFVWRLRISVWRPDLQEAPQSCCDLLADKLWALSGRALGGGTLLYPYCGRAQSGLDRG